LAARNDVPQGSPKERHLLAGTGTILIDRPDEWAGIFFKDAFFG
jgi:hypothetical protein